MVRLPAIALCFAVAACYGPTAREGLPCSESGRCPDGQSCGTDGICRSTPLPDTADAGPEPDGSDGGVDRLIDPPIRISEMSGASSVPSLVWTGNEYGVAWVKDRGGNDEIFFSRVDPSGVILTDQVRVTDAAGDARDPSLAWSGSEYGLVWSDGRDGNQEIYFQRIDAAGALAGAAVRITDDPEFSGTPALVWAGSEYGVAWSDGRDASFHEVYFTRLAADGTQVGSQLRVTTEDRFSGGPSVTWTGSEYGLAWDDFRNDNADVFFSRVSASGEENGDDIEVTVGDAAEPANASGAVLMSVGPGFTVAWLDFRGSSREVYLASLGPTGTNQSGDIPITDEPISASGLSAVWTGAEVGLAWSENTGESDDLFFRRVESSGDPLGDPVALADGPENSRSSALVHSGSAYGVAWVDDRDGDQEIYLGEVAP